MTPGISSGFQVDDFTDLGVGDWCGLLEFFHRGLKSRASVCASARVGYNSILRASVPPPASGRLVPPLLGRLLAIRRARRQNSGCARGSFGARHGKQRNGFSSRGLLNFLSFGGYRWVPGWGAPARFLNFMACGFCSICGNVLACTGPNWRGAGERAGKLSCPGRGN